MTEASSLEFEPLFFPSHSSLLPPSQKKTQPTKPFTAHESQNNGRQSGCNVTYQIFLCYSSNNVDRETATRFRCPQRHITWDWMSGCWRLSTRLANGSVLPVFSKTPAIHKPSTFSFHTQHPFTGKIQLKKCVFYWKWDHHVNRGPYL